MPTVDIDLDGGEQTAPGTNMPPLSPMVVGPTTLPEPATFSPDTAAPAATETPTADSANLSGADTTARAGGAAEAGETALPPEFVVFRDWFAARAPAWREQLLDYLPTLIIVFVPLAACLLPVGLGLRRRHLWVEHTVALFHIHAALYLGCTVWLALSHLWKPLAASDTWPLLLLAGLMGYVGLALRRIYALRWRSLLWRLPIVFMVCCFGLILAVAALGAALLGWAWWTQPPSGL